MHPYQYPKDFSDAMALASRSVGESARCDDCARPPHPTTKSLYAMDSNKLLCLSCFFTALGKQRRESRESCADLESLRKRAFTSMLFFGNGELSMEQQALLLTRVDHAFNYLSAMQQPPMATDPKGSAEAHRRFCAEGELIIETVVKDFATALTGKEWEPKKE